MNGSFDSQNFFNQNSKSFAGSTSRDLYNTQNPQDMANEAQNINDRINRSDIGYGNQGVVNDYDNSSNNVGSSLGEKDGLGDDGGLDGNKPQGLSPEQEQQEQQEQEEQQEQQEQEQSSGSEESKGKSLFHKDEKKMSLMERLKFKLTRAKIIGIALAIFAGVYLFMTFISIIVSVITGIVKGIKSALGFGDDDDFDDSDISDDDFDYDENGDIYDNRPKEDEEESSTEQQSTLNHASFSNGLLDNLMDNRFEEENSFIRNLRYDTKDLDTELLISVSNNNNVASYQIIVDNNYYTWITEDGKIIGKCERTETNCDDFSYANWKLYTDNKSDSIKLKYKSNEINSEVSNEKLKIILNSIFNKKEKDNESNIEKI